MKRICFVTIYAFLLIVTWQDYGYAQIQNIDSFKLMLNTKVGWRSAPIGKAQTNCSIASEYLILKEFDKANEYLDRALHIEDSIIGADINDSTQHYILKLAIHNKISALTLRANYNLHTLGRCDVALDNLQKALDICRYSILPSDYGWIYSIIANVYVYKGDYGTALEYFHQSLDSLLKSPDIPNNNSKIYSIAETYVSMGMLNKQLGNYTEAINYFNRALPIYTKVNRDENRRAEDIAATYTKLGSVYLALSDYPQALKNYLEAFHLYNSFNFKPGIASSYMNIGDIYKNQGNYDDALDNYKKALEIFTQLKSDVDVALCYSSIGVVLKTKKQYDESLSYLNRVLDMTSKTGNKSQVAANLNAVGDLYFNIAINLEGSNGTKTTDSLFNLSVFYSNRALDINRSINTKPEIASTLLTIANSQAGLGKYDEALKNCEEGLSIAKSIPLKYEIKDCYAVLERIAEKKGEFKKALNYYSLFVLYKDSLINEATNKQLTDLWVSYETEQKNNEINLLNKEKSIKDLTIENQGTKISEQQLDELQEANEIKLLNQDKEIQALSLSKNQSQLKEQQIIEQADANKLGLLNEEKKAQQAEIKRQSAIKDYSILVAILVLLLSAVVVNGYFVVRKQKTAILKEKARSEQLLQTQLAELESSALRAQMNPHFVFNSLNSIQKYIWDSEPKQATEYLTRFAKLIRFILENSREDKVSLEKDLSALNLYLELEAFRFNHKFEYAISCAADIDKNETYIPPMIIQPFVENAIIHGLNPKKNGGKLLIEVKKKNGNKLLITIEDNGVGRATTKEINYDDNRSHKSLGMQVTRERVENLSNLNMDSGAISITDLLDELKQPCGTKVEIELSGYN